MRAEVRELGKFLKKFLLLGIVIQTIILPVKVEAIKDCDGHEVADDNFTSNVAGPLKIWVPLINFGEVEIKKGNMEIIPEYFQAINSDPIWPFLLFEDHRDIGSDSILKLRRRKSNTLFQGSRLLLFMTSDHDTNKYNLPNDNCTLNSFKEITQDDIIFLSFKTPDKNTWSTISFSTIFKLIIDRGELIEEGEYSEDLIWTLEDAYID